MLFKLTRKPGLRQADLPTCSTSSRSRLSRIIDRLQEAELVERPADPADRRAWRLQVTAKAKPLVAKLRAIADELSAEAFAGIAAKDIETTGACWRRCASARASRNR